jgi:glycosyltransferase involved in cell wall biosynthesis
MRVAHVIPGAGPASFGGGVVALNLVREQCEQGVVAEIWSPDTVADRQWAIENSGLKAESFRRFEYSWPANVKWSREMEQAASREAAGISLVHQHAIWAGVSRVSLMLRKKFGIPTVVTPHGSLETWALGKSRLKKQVALTLYERENMQRASCLYACSEAEVSGFRDFGLKNPVAVIPNGVPAEWLTCRGNADDFRSRHGIPAGKRILLFLSRITPKKGLPLLVEALIMNRDRLSDWHLVIAGDDEFNHKTVIEGLIRSRNLDEHVTFSGPLFDQAKIDAFSASDLFVLPTLSENFGIVVIEALGAGVPVITTKGAPWEVLVSSACGWWTEVSHDAIAEALRDAFSRTPDQLRQMGQRGRELVASGFTWQQAARKTIELYEWLLGRGERPDFVICD